MQEKKLYQILFKELGLKKTIELRKQVKEFWTFGDALADVITNQEEVYLPF